MTKHMHRKAVILILALSIVGNFVFGFFFIQGILGDQDTLEEAVEEAVTECLLSDREFIPPAQNRIATQRDYLNLSFSPIDDGSIEGGIALDIAETLELGTIHLETPQDPLTVTVGNGNSELSNLLLKVFYNYEEVAFLVDGASQAETEFLFGLEAGYKVDIPIQLSDNLEAGATMSKLTVGIFHTPEHFTGNLDSLSDELVFGRHRHNVIVNLDINYGYNENLVLNINQFKPFDESEFFGLSIDTDPAIYGDGSLASPGLPVVVRPEEELELTLFANSRQLVYEEIVDDVLLDPYLIDDFVVVAMLDWHQIPISGKPFMWANIEDANPRYGQHINFTIVAPEEPGFYEFSAFLVPSPGNKVSVRNFFPLETVPRFTVEVVDTD